MLLNTRDLIARMSPTTLAGLIVDMDNYQHQDAAERETMALVREALECNVGRGEAELLITEACGGKRTPADEGLATAMQYANQDIDQEQARLLKETRTAKVW